MALPFFFPGTRRAIKSVKGLGLRLGTIIRTIASPVTFTTFESAPKLRPTMIFETIRGTRLGDPLLG